MVLLTRPEELGVDEIPNTSSVLGIDSLLRKETVATCMEDQVPQQECFDAMWDDVGENLAMSSH